MKHVLTFKHTLSFIKTLVTTTKTQVQYEMVAPRYLGHVTGYQPISDQYYLTQSVPASKYFTYEVVTKFIIKQSQLMLAHN